MPMPNLQPEFDRQAERSAFELELARAITEVINMELPPERIDDPDNRHIFASLRNLAAHIAHHRSK